MLIPFKAWHLWSLDLQPEQLPLRNLFSRDYARALEGSRAMSAMIDRSPVMCAGLAVLDDGRTWAWAVLGVDAQPAMLEATRACRTMLAKEGEVFTMVRSGFAEGARWLRLLGFEPTGGDETGPDGRSYEVWVKR